MSNNMKVVSLSLIFEHYISKDSIGIYITYKDKFTETIRQQSKFFLSLKVSPENNSVPRNFIIKYGRKIQEKRKSK